MSVVMCLKSGGLRKRADLGALPAGQASAEADQTLSGAWLDGSQAGNSDTRPHRFGSGPVPINFLSLDGEFALSGADHFLNQKAHGLLLLNYVRRTVRQVATPVAGQESRRRSGRRFASTAPCPAVPRAVGGAHLGREVARTLRGWRRAASGRGHRLRCGSRGERPRGRKDETARTHARGTLTTAEEADLTFEDVELLVFVVVDVIRGAKAGRDQLLDQTQRTVSIGGGGPMPDLACRPGTNGVPVAQIVAIRVRCSLLMALVVTVLLLRTSNITIHGVP